MQTEEMVSANDFCTYHSIDVSFIYSLSQSGLIEVTNIEKEAFVPISQLKHIEQMMRMHHEMDINLEGIETIIYLLQRINNMQQQIVKLTNQLSLYENDY
jgi:chaperone modulatory protein CbpM